MNSVLRFAAARFAAFLCLGLGAGALAAGLEAQSDFATPEQAIEALIKAVRNDDQRELLRILGPTSESLIRSGDEVADRSARLRLVNAYDAAHHVDFEKPGIASLVVGPEQWELPIPIVQQDEHWHFNTDAGLQKILDRRVGRNELNVIRVCREYVAAQREYALQDKLSKGPGQYAQKLDSSAGMHDGLYWEAAAGAPPSPFGPLVARARAHGYAAGEGHDVPAPYHGYFYRILTRQGAHAPGGAKDYVVDGRMTRGFALLAFPAKWGDSGVMTFIVDQDGIVFEKNLGPETGRLAPEIGEYDPDPSWRSAAY
jgi:hypothetical protein